MKKLIWSLMMLAVLITCKKEEVETKGHVQGTIRTTQSLPIEGALVTLNPGGNAKITAVDGKFEFRDLQPNDYQITVAKTGFISNTQSITIVAGQTKTLDFNLNVEETSLDITNPESSSIWKAGTVQNITWLSNSGGKVKIELYKSGTFLRIIDDQTDNDGSYSWNIPAELVLSTDYKIKITSLVNPNIYDFSDYFTIADVALPSVSTTPVTQITSLSAKAGGNVVNDGNSEVLERGICWGTITFPGTSGTHIVLGSGLGSFEYVLSDLVPNTNYYVRAYATNSVGTSYGDQVSFTTTNQVVLPAVITFETSNVTTSAATAGGRVMDDGNGTLTQRGVCWATTPNPTIESSHLAAPVADTGNFTLNITGLGANNNYYLRAYAVNEAGAAYGNQVTFTTNPDILLATITTTEVTQITNTGAVSGGNITSSGNGVISEKGICWSISSTPTITDSHNAEGNGMGAFSSAMTNLLPFTTYYVRAYAVNQAGTAYGAAREFKTLPTISLPTVTTTDLTSISSSAANSGGNVTSAGNGTVSARGVCWNISPSPSLANQYTSDGNGIGIYTSTMIGLNPVTTYYVRAYATNQAGTAYGEELNFTTLAVVLLPTVTTSEITQITMTTATGGGNVSSDGNGTVTSRGICWAITQNPTLSNFYTNDGNGSGSFTSAMTGLQSNTTYYVRAYATNSAGTAYGNQVNFTTSNVTTVTDYDGNVYETVQIGSQVWMKENLKNTHYQNGEPIPNVTDNSTWIGLTTGAYCDYENNSSNVDTYGRMYNWYAASDSRNICPSGWHVPTDNEFKTLEIFLGMTQAQADEISYRGTDQGNQLKEAGNTHWISPSAGTNSSGFTALPGGYRYNAGTFNDMGGWGYWWSSTQDNESIAWIRFLGCNSAMSGRGHDIKSWGFSVRCLQGEATTSLPTITTGEITSITNNSATVGGNVTNDGGASVTERGICWSTFQNPSISDSHVSSGSGTGAFTENLTELQSNTSYYVRAYAINSVGTAYGNQVQFATTSGFTCGSSFTVTHTTGDVAPVTKTVTYGTVETNLTGTNKCWITQNLGADHQASSATDNTEASAGWYWQFNRQQGFKHDGTIRTPNTTWITSIEENSDWQIANDPCISLLGAGWRIPTNTEWQTAAGGWNSYNDSYNSVLKLHTSGWLYSGDGTLNYRGSGGYYWSSTQVNATSGYDLNFNNSYSFMSVGVKTYGFSARCLKD